MYFASAEVTSSFAMVKSSGVKSTPVILAPSPDSLLAVIDVLLVPHVTFRYSFRRENIFVFNLSSNHGVKQWLQRGFQRSKYG